MSFSSHVPRATRCFPTSRSVYNCTPRTRDMPCTTRSPRYMPTLTAIAPFSCFWYNSCGETLPKPTTAHRPHAKFRFSNFRRFLFLSPPVTIPLLILDDWRFFHDSDFVQTTLVVHRYHGCKHDNSIDLTIHTHFPSLVLTRNLTVRFTIVFSLCEIGKKVCEVKFNEIADKSRRKPFGMRFKTIFVAIIDLLVSTLLACLEPRACLETCFIRTPCSSFQSYQKRLVSKIRMTMLSVFMCRFTEIAVLMTIVNTKQK